MDAQAENQLDTILLESIAAGDTEASRRLLDEGADPNARDLVFRN